MGNDVTEIWGRLYLKLRLRLSLETRNLSLITNLPRMACEHFSLAEFR